MSLMFMDKHPELEIAIANSGVTESDFVRMTNAVIATYDKLAENMVGAWRTSKPAHARKARLEVAEFADILGLTSKVVLYLALAAAAHDLGRMVLGHMRKGTRPPYWMYNYIFDPVERAARGLDPLIDDDQKHGYESVQLLLPILGSFAETDAGKWLVEAVRWHSLKDNPTLDMCLGSSACLAVCLIIRDLDKVLGFQDAADYTSNPERMAKERLQNWPKQVEQDPKWGTERGAIVPAHFLMEIPLETAIVRQECESYEAYMLQYFKWSFGFGSEEMLKVALAQGGPQIVAAYLLKRLEATPPQRAHFLNQLRSWRNGLILSYLEAA